MADENMVEALMELSEMMLPMIEFAEGERRRLEDRGWSSEAAEEYAIVVLVAITKKAWEGATQ